ncbi:MAG: HAMP domain-containing histidine kinase [Sporolactobacillus sp.]|nr:HAMP domain-containing histidine kinase [Sporolactobacillus sp.]
MFNHLRKQLTLVYSLCFFMTLVILFIILFFVFRNMIYQSIRIQVEDIVRDQATLLSHGRQPQGSAFKHSLLSLVYFPSAGNATVYHGKMPNALHRELKRRIGDGRFSGVMRTKWSDGKGTLVIYAAHPVRKNHRTAGFVIAVQGIHRTHELIEYWFRLLFLLGLSAASLSFLIAHFLAKRAIAPIKRNYEKQKAFVADASHEMRTPLSVFSAGLQYLAAEERPHLSEAAQETLNDLKEEVDEMNALIGHLLTLARSDQNLLGENRSDFALFRLLHSVTLYYRRLAQREQKTFVTDFPTQETILYANPMEIRQLFTLFLDNAFNYTHLHDRITLTVRIDEKTKRLLLIIADTGIGIPEKDQPNIYERFFRVEKGRSREKGGNGLGLSIANAIIRAYDGQIHLKSTLGKGTVFQIELPILSTHR